VKFFTLIMLLFVFSAGQATAQKSSVDKKALNNELKGINERFKAGFGKSTTTIDAADPKNDLADLEKIEFTTELTEFSGCRIGFVTMMKQRVKDGETINIQQRRSFSLKVLDMEKTRLSFQDGIFRLEVVATGREISYEQITDGKNLATGGRGQRESRNFVNTALIKFRSSAKPEEVSRDLGRAIEICELL